MGVDAERVRLFHTLPSWYESLTDYVASLTKLIVRCAYQQEFQATLLRDRFVCGLFSESTRKRLLTEDDKLTLERALQDL